MDFAIIVCRVKVIAIKQNRNQKPSAAAVFFFSATLEVREVIFVEKSNCRTMTKSQGERERMRERWEEASRHHTVMSLFIVIFDSNTLKRFCCNNSVTRFGKNLA